jgi:hypothetical protein
MKNNIKENFRRLWPIVLVWMLLDLIAGPFVALLDTGDTYLPEYTYGNGSPVLLLINMGFALIIGVAVFRYAHSSSSISIMHSLPIRRSTLFTVAASGMRFS